MYKFNFLLIVPNDEWTCHLERLLSCPWWESWESSDILQDAAGTIWGLNSSTILKKGDSSTSCVGRSRSCPSLGEVELELITLNSKLHCDSLYSVRWQKCPHENRIFCKFMKAMFDCCRRPDLSWSHWLHHWHEVFVNARWSTAFGHSICHYFGWVWQI